VIDELSAGDSKHLTLWFDVRDVLNSDDVDVWVVFAEPTLSSSVEAKGSVTILRE
jgi:hypothetical protein